jgi:hypothetical protein
MSSVKYLAIFKSSQKHFPFLFNCLLLLRPFNNHERAIRRLVLYSFPHKYIFILSCQSLIQLPLCVRHTQSFRIHLHCTLIIFLPIICSGLLYMAESTQLNEVPFCAVKTVVVVIVHDYRPNEASFGKHYKINLVTIF